jgi:hypothetical protein
MYKDKYTFLCFFTSNVPKGKCKFNSELQTKFPCFKAGRNENVAECTVCKTFCVSSKGSYNLEAHCNTAKHKKQIQSYHNTLNISEVFIKQNSNG